MLVWGILLWGAILGLEGQEFQVRIDRPDPDHVRLRWNQVGSGFDYVVKYRGLEAEHPWLIPNQNHPLPLRATNWIDSIQPTIRGRGYRVVAVPRTVRGKLLRATFQRKISTAEIQAYFFLIGISTPIRYGVKVYTLEYQTVDPWGMPTRASGTLMLPDAEGQLWPIVSYQHGTTPEKDEVPSQSYTWEYFVGLGIATRGYVTVIPDYLGLGTGPGMHPYHHARSEATAAVDCLRAVREFCQDHQIGLNGRLFLCGYSQGGHATMALHRELEWYHAEEFPVTASAPMAGAYDLSGTMVEDFLSGRQVSNPYYLAYVVVAYFRVYHPVDSLKEWLRAPYDQTLPQLLDGTHGPDEINEAMPNPPIQIFRPEVIEAVRENPDYPLRILLRQNDVYRWCPKAPVRLYHCSGDQDVPYANSVRAFQYFQSVGARSVQLIDPLPGGTHTECGGPAILSALDWFDSFR